MALLGEMIQAKNTIRRKKLNRIFYGLEVKKAHKKRKTRLEQVPVSQMANSFIQILCLHKWLNPKVATTNMTFEEKVVFLVEFYDDNEKVDQLYGLYKAIYAREKNILIEQVKKEVKNIALGKYSSALRYDRSL